MFCVKTLRTYLTLFLRTVLREYLQIWRLSATTFRFKVNRNCARVEVLEDRTVVLPLLLSAVSTNVNKLLHWLGHDCVTWPSIFYPQLNLKIISCYKFPLHTCGSSVGIATRYGLEGPGIESRWGRDFPHPSRPATEPTQPPVNGYRVFSGVKAAGAWCWPHTPF